MATQYDVLLSWVVLVIIATIPICLLYTDNQAHKSSYQKGHLEGKKSVLNPLVLFGPSRLPRICLEAGVQFFDPIAVDDDEVDKYAAEYEQLVQELREEVKAVLRQTLSRQVEAEVKNQLKKEIRAQLDSEGHMVGLIVTVMEEIRRDLKGAVVESS